jgi:hypothetical protein
VMQLQSKADQGGGAPEGPVLHPFRVTFGQRFRSEHHPFFVVGRLDFEPHPDGWVTVLAVDVAQARIITVDRLGLYWSMLNTPWDLADAGPEWLTRHPRGELARFDQVANPEDQG